MIAQPPLRRAPILAAALLLAAAAAVSAPAAEFEQAAGKAREFRGDTPVAALPTGLVLAEAEEFRPATGGGASGAGDAGWRAKNWGENYYAATFANSFLSRKAFLGAEAQTDKTEASLEVEVPQAGKYLALVRYEAAFRFETQFRLRVEQGGAVKLDRLYGARDNVKIWAFPPTGGLKKEVGWSWGAVENSVWEGHDVFVDLAAGRAKLTLVADRQPEPAAKRNIDAVMLITPERAELDKRLAKDRHLPLDGLLTQAGDVFLRVQNTGATPLKLTVPNGVEHSPYWVHLRDWKPKTLDAAPGQATEWEEVGSLLDTLNDGAWALRAEPTVADKNAPLSYKVEIGLKSAAGKIETIGTFESAEKDLRLAYDGNTRYTRRVRLLDGVLYDLLAYLKAQPTRGTPPKRTIVYCYTFDERQPEKNPDGSLKPLSPADAKFNAARKEFLKLVGLTTVDTGDDTSASVPAGYIDIRGKKPEELPELGKKLVEDAKKAGANLSLEQVRTVSLGDEIGMPAPKPDAHGAYQAWAKARGLKPSDADATAGEDWAKVQYQNPAGATEREALARTNPGQLYYSTLYAYDFGIEQLKATTDLVKKQLPNADTGANFSPHADAPYLGTASQWITLFRRGGMTMPWSEDYIWQLPIGTQEMNFILLDLARAANRYAPERDIQFYVMPHWPGNTPTSWRRLFYGCLGHGMTVVNLFEFRPVQAAYTENHTSLPEMYAEVRKSLYELGTFEDLIQDGHVRPGVAALWYSQAGDVWDNHRDPFGAGKRTLYIAARHNQLPLDIVDEEDALKGELKNYKVLYLADLNVSAAATKAIAAWVEAGGHLFATAGAGMADELNRPNKAMQELLGIEQTTLETPGDVKIHFEKQDLPFAKEIDRVAWEVPAAMQAPGRERVYFKTDAGDKLTIPVFGARSRFTVKAAKPEGTFADGSPAVARREVGKGSATYCGFLPGLSYFKPAIPLRPVDRGSTDDAMAHFVPTKFDSGAGRLVGSFPVEIERPVACSVPFVEATVVEAKGGLVIPLTNWSGGPVKGLRVEVRGQVPAKAELAGGGVVAVTKEGERTIYTLDLDTADALVLR